MPKSMFARLNPMAGRTEPSFNARYRVSQKTEEYFKDSLRNGSKKDKKKFEGLTKDDKRKWREALQRAIAAVKSRLAQRVLSGIKPRGKTMYRMQRLTALEEQLIAGLRSSDLEQQAGWFAPKTMGAIENAVKSINTTSDNVSDFLQFLKTQITELIENMKRVGDILCRVALAALFMWLLTSFAHLPVIHAGVLTLVGIFIPEIASKIAEMCKPCTVETQMGGFAAASNLLSLITMLWIPGKSALGYTNEFLKRVSNFPKAADGLETFMTRVCDMFFDFIGFVAKLVGCDLPFKRKEDCFRKWKQEVAEVVRQLDVEPSVPIEVVRRCNDLMTTGYGFHQLLVTESSKRELNFWIEKLGLKMQPHRGAMQAEVNVRAMPYFFMFGGPSGAGKTSLLRLVGATTLILAGEVSGSEALEQLWQKGTTQFWNGYVGQKCLVMDDAFQVIGKTGDPDSEAMNVIRACGNWSMPLNYADLASKGRFYLNTPLMIGTTNCRNVAASWSSFITEPEALVRRFQGAYWIEAAGEYKLENGRFDFNKFDQEFDACMQRITENLEKGVTYTKDELMSELPWDAWTLREHDFKSDNINGPQFTGGLRRAVEIAAQEMVNRREVNKKQVTNLKKWTGALKSALDAGLELQAGSEIEEEISVDDSSHEVEQMSIEEEDDTFFSRMYLHARKKGVEFVDYAKRVNEGFCDEENKAFEAISSIYKRVVEWVKTLPLIRNVDWNTVGKLLLNSSLVLLAIGAAFGLLKAAVSGFWSLVGGFLKMIGIKPKVKNQSNEGVSVQKKEKFMRLTSYTPVYEQIGVPPNEDIHDHVFENSVKCVTERGELGQFLGLGADVFIFPKHFLKYIREEDPSVELQFHSIRHNSKFTITCGAFLERPIEEIEGFDLAGVSFGAVFLKANRNIIGYFLKQEEMKSILRGSNVPVRLDVAQLKNNIVRRHIYHSRTCEYVGALSETGGQVMGGLLKYNASTVKGDCGAPLCLTENRNYGMRCVMGIHSAGRDSIFIREGYSTSVPQEVAISIFLKLASFKEDTRKWAKVMMTPTGKDRVELQDALQEQGIVDGSFELLGVLEKPVNVASFTKLKSTPMQEEKLFGDCPTAPAVLRSKMVDGVMQYPMANAMRAYQTPLVCKESAQLEVVTEVAMEKHWDNTKHYPRSILSFEEAIVPPEHWRMKPINRKTSAGYKYKEFATPQTPGKTHFLGFEGDVDFTRKEMQILRDDVNDIIENARVGERTLHLATDFLKDELRPLKKVETVATRGIAGTELDYTITCRMYFGAFMAATFATHVSNGMAPGINHYQEWYMIAEGLLGNNRKKVFDGDFSRFDSSEQPWVHNSILSYINKWYRYNNADWNEEDDRVRYVLWLDLVHSRHVTGAGCALKYVVQWNKSLPSGHPLTTIVNSMYSLITLVGCYMKRMDGARDFWQHAFTNTFGDDNLTAVDDDVCDAFNQVTVAEDMKELFDLTYTSGKKDAELVPFTDITDVTFLKRTFRRDNDPAGGLVWNTPNQGWVAPLAPESWLYEGYWYKNGRDPVGDVSRRIEHTLCEASMHDQEVWENVYPKLEDFCHRHGIEMPLTSRAAVRDHMKKRFDVWF